LCAIAVSEVRGLPGAAWIGMDPLAGFEDIIRGRVQGVGFATTPDG